MLVATSSEMFKPIMAIVFVIFSHSYTDGKQFRFDYKYYPEAEGWLKLHQVPANWHEARLRCHYEGAELASPLSENHLTAMKAHMSTSKTPCGVFSGVHATFSRGDYSSIEGVPLSKMSITWAPDEPDNSDDSENCLIFLPNGMMADVKCEYTFPYMCFKKKTIMVITECGTIDNQYTLDTRTGSCYKFHRNGQTWSRAYMTCAAEGGHLAIINSDMEAQVLKEVFAKQNKDTISSKYKDSAAIGFHDWGERGTWLTIHGKTLEESGYAKWVKGQPDNATWGGVGESCGSILTHGLFDDVWCNINLAFICEKSPDSLMNLDN